MIEDFIEQRKDQLVQIVSNAIKIKSTEELPEEGAPFGKGVKEALVYALKVSEDLGFKAVNLNNVLGYAEFGEGDEVISVLGHLDVVPEGTDWKYPPYGGETHEGRLYGRGTIDDKGPIFAALFGLYALKETQTKLSKRVRIIFGTNEETGWKCMDHLKAVLRDPLIGFTPDAEFPVINREKGILNVTLRKDFATRNEEVYIVGGERPNMVPDHAEARFNHKIELELVDSDVYIQGNTVVARGISAHGALPEKGKNAISMIANAIKSSIANEEVKDIIRFINEAVGKEVDGRSLGIKMSDEPSHDLTANLGTIEVNESYGTLTFNIRYPVTKDYKDIVSKIALTASKYGLKVAQIRNQDPLFVKDDEPLIKTLLAVYEKFTGQKGYTISIGGGTYARAMDKGVAFGPGMPGMEAVEHMANEYIEISHLVKITKIYGNAIYELAK
ncbi:MAG: dipeptidase PepV [Caldisericaceae bacterium]